MNRKNIIYALLILVGLFISINTVNAKENDNWEGDGTNSSPYLIESVDDLVLLRDNVNSGETYEDVYFRQTENIYLSEPWVPIGIYDTEQLFVFKGIYDGYGHIIDGLNNGEDYNGFALFENFDGVIANLGLTNVDIEATSAAAFVLNTTSKGEEYPAIINCYVTGTINGDGCAGIAVNFDGGEIVNCISYVDMSEEDAKGILYSYNGTQIYHCFSTRELCVKNIVPAASKHVEKEFFYEEVKKNSSVYFALSQILYGNRHGVELKKWFVIPDDNSGLQVLYTDDIGLVERALFFINVYLAPIILLLIIGVIALKRGELSEASITPGVVITLILTVFSDISALLLPSIDFSFGKILYLLLINGLCFFFIYKDYKKIKYTIKNIKVSIPFILILGIIVISAAGQFDTVPRYDAALYYGSFSQSRELFGFDLFTFAGAFVCWKWIQGIALIIEPFELIWPGQMTGIYVGTLIIVIASYYFLYKLLIRLTNLNDSVCAVLSGVLIFCPYQMGMFTYFSMDNYLAYFAVWLLYSYFIDNDYLIVFSGFILIFTKDTGLVFYVAFLVFATAAQLLLQYKKKFFTGVVKWWQWKKVLLWISPALLYLFKNKIAGAVRIQNFYGTGGAGLFEPRNIYSYLNTVCQSCVWGLRWLFLLIFIIAVVRICCKKVDIYEIINKESIGIYAGVFGAMMVVIAMLLAYQGDAECPRYTAILNAGFVVLLAFSVQCIVNGVKKACILAGGVGALMLVQTYFTIDPSIFLMNSYLETGGNRLYRLCLKNDTRPSMNLGLDYGLGFGSVSDVCVYNTQYNYYNSLISKMLKDIKPDEYTKLYVLDVMEYELLLSGQQYPFFWDSEDEKFTYKQDDNAYILNSSYLISVDLQNNMVENLEDDFYVIAPSRVDTISSSIDSLKHMGYNVVDSKEYKNLNGAMYVFHVSRL